MTVKKYFFALAISLFFTGQFSASATDHVPSVHRKTKNPAAIGDTLSWSVNFMKKFSAPSGEWFISNEPFARPMKGIVDYAENAPIDTIVVNMDKLLKCDSISLIFDRKADNIPNKKVVPGYLSAEEIDRQAEARKKTVADSLLHTRIAVPEPYLTEGTAQAPLIPAGDPLQLINATDRNLPAAFKSKVTKGWAGVKLPAFVTPAEIDSMKSRLVAQIRRSYNDSVLMHQRDSLVQRYRESFIAQLSADAASQKTSFLTNRNRELLIAFNEKEVGQMNDSVRMALRFLTNRAAADSTLLSLANISGDRTKIWTANRPMPPMRMFIKNEQHDSLSVILYNNGKGGLRLVIEDGVKFLRFTESQKKEITFNPKKPDSKLHKVNLPQVDPLPWTMFGTGNIGFSQTTLSNWAKGGESSLSMLLIEKYVANYSKRGLKWENMVEFRLGFFSSKSRGVEKNDDKLEVQSRIGYSAFKKWYYSGESNFRTQVARGYKFPDKTNPISTFMAPAYLTFSIGMDYKPNKNFSLFLSPITSKTTFVLDTALIKAKNYGLAPGKRKLWEPGFIAKMNLHWRIMPNINYDTRAEVFNDYRYPFQKFNINWEESLVMEVNRHINTRVMSQLIYDYNVKFPIKDATGKQIASEARWQFMELFSIGFNYKF